MENQRSRIRSVVLIERIRLVAIGVFLSFVLGGVLAPSAAKALPFEYSLDFDSSICRFCRAGTEGALSTLYFTFDSTRITFDTSKMLNRRIDTNLNSYLLSVSSFRENYLGDITSIYMTSVSPSSSSWDYTSLRLSVGIYNPDPNSAISTIYWAVEEQYRWYGSAELIAGSQEGERLMPQVAGVPEPSTVLSLSLGLVMLAGWRRKLLFN
ncbi:MAG: PEP-CTERM sorting domain-containing protein [Nitrospira sp.]|nr:PEP-CTERM sorting domain-containing protein [Nitrospira sp.]